MYHAKNNAAFINAIAEEGTKAEAVEYLQRTYDELCDAKSKLDALTAQAHESKRWNMHSAGPGELQVCFGDHERGTACQYVNYVEASRLDANLEVLKNVVEERNELRELLDERTQDARQAGFESITAAIHQATERGCRLDSTLDVLRDVWDDAGEVPNALADRVKAALSSTAGAQIAARNARGVAEADTMLDREWSPPK